MPDLNDDALDRALDAAGAVMVSRTPELESMLDELVLSTQRRARRRRVGRKGSIVAAGALSLVLVGGAAAASGVWAPWAEHPDGTFTYVLPSGLVCEERVGDFHADNPAVQVEVQRIFADIDVVSVADVESWRERLTKNPEYAAVVQEWIDSGDSQVSTIEDAIAMSATSNAVMEVVQAELADRGFSPAHPDNMISVSGQSLCDGARQ